VLAKREPIDERDHRQDEDAGQRGDAHAEHEERERAGERHEHEQLADRERGLARAGDRDGASREQDREHDVRDAGADQADRTPLVHRLADERECGAMQREGQ